MDSSKIMLLILGMALVTYIPRAVPAVLVNKIRFGQRTKRFLRLIPYTAMSALIFPAVFSVDAANPWIGIAGVAVAALLAFRKCPVMVCVLAAIATDFFLYLVI